MRANNKLIFAAIVAALIVSSTVVSVFLASIGHPEAEWMVCEILGFSGVCS